jgi:hypothetical protein
MQRKLRPLNAHTISGFEFLDTPGDEIAPGSNEIRKDFEDDWLGHVNLLPICFDSSRDWDPKSKYSAAVFSKPQVDIRSSARIRFTQAAEETAPETKRIKAKG